MRHQFGFVSKLFAALLSTLLAVATSTSAQADNVLVLGSKQTSTTATAGGLSIFPVSNSLSLSVWYERVANSTGFKLMTSKVSATGVQSTPVKAADVAFAFSKAPYIQTDTPRFAVAVSKKKAIQIAYLNTYTANTGFAQIYTYEINVISSTNGTTWSKPVRAVKRGVTLASNCGHVCGYIVTSLTYDKSNRLHLVYAFGKEQSKTSLMSTSSLDLKTWAKPAVIIANQNPYYAARVEVAPSATGLVAAGLSHTNAGDAVWTSVKATSSSTSWGVAAEQAAACANCSINSVHVIPQASGDVTLTWLETTAGYSPLQLNAMVWSHTSKTWGAKTNIYTSVESVSGLQSGLSGPGLTPIISQNGKYFAFAWFEATWINNMYGPTDFKAVVVKDGVFGPVMSMHQQTGFGIPSSFQALGISVGPTGSVALFLGDYLSNPFMTEASDVSPAAETQLPAEFSNFGGIAGTYNVNGKLLILELSVNQINTTTSRTVSVVTH